MKVFLVRRSGASWCEDDAMVIIAEDELHAERKARWSSNSFTNEYRDRISIEEISLDEESCVLKSNVGA